MKKNRIYIIFIIVILIVGFFGSLIYKFTKNGYSGEIRKYRYMWLFKDSIRKDVDTTFTGVLGFVRKNVSIYDYNYSKIHKIGFTNKDTVLYITILELKDLGEADLRNVIIKKKQCLYDLKFKTNITFAEDSDPKPKIITKIGFEFKNHKLDVNLDDTTEVYKTFDSTYYKGFYGKVNKMSLSDTNGEHLILFKFKESTKTFFIIYKAKQSFYVIYVNSNHEDLINENIIKMFNIK